MKLSLMRWPSGSAGKFLREEQPDAICTVQRSGLQEPGTYADKPECCCHYDEEIASERWLGVIGIANLMEAAGV